MNIDIKALLLQGAVDHMKKRRDNIKSSVKTILNASLLIVEREAKIEAPTLSGRLKNSITEGKQLYPTYATIGPTVEYAKFVHSGHAQEVGRYVPALGKRLVEPFVKGNPFMFRAANSARPKINQFVKDTISKAIE